MRSPPQGSKPRAGILVVDDDPRSRRLLEGYIKGEGYCVRGAGDGPTALRMATEQVPDVVLLDVMMPGMTGFEVCQALKNNPKTRLTQIMMVTALDGIPDKVQGLDTGADDYVTKPVRREEFLAKVRALLRARTLLVDLEQARAELAARNRELELKKTLAQTLVHDLKNPLSAIVGNLGLLATRGSEEIEHLIERCQEASSRMRRMILDLLDVEGLEEGRYVLDSEELDLAEVVCQAVGEADIPARQRKVRVVVDAPGDPCLVEGDPAVLRRVVDNLIANAVQHSPTDGTVAVTVAYRAEGVEVAVSDQGNGIPENFRERIFDKYARLDLRQSGVTANRGLGLTFSRLAVETHGGSIWVEEAPGGGAVFRTLLPGAEPSELPATEAALAGALPMSA